MKRTKEIEFGKVKGRDEKLIMKGGDETFIHSTLNAELYFPNKEVMLTRLDNGIIPFDKRYKRGYHGSIYMRENSPDYYDSTSI